MRRRWIPWFLVLGVWLAVAGMPQRLEATPPGSTWPTASDAQHHLGMQPEFVAEVDPWGDRPRHHITAELTLDNDALIRGQQTLRYTNTTGVPLDRIVFRLYPNTPPLRDAGIMTVSHAQVNGEPVIPQLSVEDSVLTVPFAAALAPGAVADIQLDFALRFYQGEISAAFERSGFFDQVVSGGSWYPALSVYEQERGWWVAPVTSGLGDPSYEEVALYDVWLTVPAEVAIVTNGVVVEQWLEADGRITYHDVSGPVRSHALMASSRYGLAATQEVDGVRVQVWAYQDDAALTPARNQAVLQTTVAALTTFRQHYGDYPYREFDVVQHPTQTGLEFAGLTIISEDAWRRGRADAIVIHEVAHQWFYGLVGNNQVEHPWLDEGLATYSEVVFERANRADGRSPVGQDLTAWLRSLTGRSPLMPLNLPVAAYDRGAAGDEYGVVYWGGAAFFVALEQELGQSVVAQALREYLQRFRYQIATSRDLQAVFEAVSGRDLAGFFGRWLGDVNAGDRPRSGRPHALP